MKTQSARHPRRLWWVLTGIAVVLLGAVAWVGIRGMIARDQLLGAAPLVSEVRDGVVDGDTAAVSSSIADLQQRAASAASLTSDPIWRAAELVPFAGPNLTAVRESAAVIDDISTGALPALETLATTFTVDSLSPVDGRIDVGQFASAIPLLGEARAAITSAADDARAIDATDTIPQVRAAVDELVDLVTQAQQLIDPLDDAVRLMPTMLGAESPRTYLVLSLNNAELRATGGIPGALAIVTADDGKLSLGTLAAVTNLPELPAPALPLTDVELELYHEVFGTYMQNVTFTPDFARTGQLAQAMWRAHTGQEIDGVIAIDPVALSYLLAATGPIEAGDGITLTPENAVSTLLSDVYARYALPPDQDAFFAGATRQIFAKLSSGAFDKQQLIGALSKAAAEHRLHIWSADADEQAVLAPTTLGGPLPTSSPESSTYGIYLNDGTGAKMGYYLRSTVDLASNLCGPSAQPNVAIRFTLTSIAPADAASSLPDYVTLDGRFGVAPGDVATNVYFYAPEGATPYSVIVDGVKTGFLSTVHEGRPVIALRTLLTPGQSTQIEVRFLGAPGTTATVALEHTPMVAPVETTIGSFSACPTDPGTTVDALGIATTSPRAGTLAALSTPG